MAAHIRWLRAVLGLIGHIEISAFMRRPQRATEALHRILTIQSGGCLAGKCTWRPLPRRPLPRRPLPRKLLARSLLPPTDVLQATHGFTSHFLHLVYQFHIGCADLAVWRKELTNTSCPC